MREELSFASELYQKTVGQSVSIGSCQVSEYLAAATTTLHDKQNAWIELNSSIDNASSQKVNILNISMEYKPIKVKRQIFKAKNNIYSKLKMTYIQS